MQKIIFLLFIITQTLLFSQNNITVINIEEYNSAIKTATAGTNIILKNGEWKNVKLKAYGKGTKDAPIVIKAEKAGEVFITGDSKLQIYGEYIVVQGLWFKDGKPTSSHIVEFKKGDELAYNCRFTHNTISHYNPEDSTQKSKWVSLWGKNNRVDHNNFTGKTNDGTTIAVWLKGEESFENNHLIDFNYFGHRPELGRNGGETIRIGTSATSMKSSKTIVENNTFKGCNGEVEIISNKSCDNIFRNNLFLESKGSLTLRHGNNAIVENNVFLGNNVSQTGGIRVINEGHIIRNNLLIGLRGVGNRAPICIMNGVPNSPANRYHQVKNVNIQNNTLIGCSPMGFAYDKDEEKTLPPMTTLFANNLFSNANGGKVFKAEDNISGITFKNNIAETTADVDSNLFVKDSIEWKLLRSLPVPSENNSNLSSSYSDSKTPNLDIVGNSRETLIVGAFNLNNNKFPKAFSTRVGPYWKPDIKTPKIETRTITVEPGVGTLRKALKKAFGAPSVLLLKDGEYFVEKEEKINGNISIIGSENTVIVSNKELEKPFKSFFKINPETRLALKNIKFDGSVKNMKYAIISPSKEESGLYSLFVDNCSFENFKDSKGAIIKSYTNTLADTISIKNSKFLNSFRGINFHSKENTSQRVNAKNLIVENSVFKSIEEYAIKYINNTPDFIPTKSGNLYISNCIFSGVFNTEKGKVIDVKNLVKSVIKNSVFENSSEIVNPINLKGLNNKVSNCLVNACGIIKTSKGAISKDILYKGPKWEDKKNFIPSEKSILLKTNNNIDNIGLIK